MLATNKFGSILDSDELIGKCEKLLKTGKTSKGQKLSKSENSKGKKLPKSKKLSKSGNSNFDTKKASLSFLTPEANKVLKRLWLAFTKAPILQYFDPKCHI